MYVGFNEQLLQIFNPNNAHEELDRISIKPEKREEVERPGQDLPPPIFAHPCLLAPSHHQQPHPVIIQSNTQGQRQPREKEHKVEEVVACALCKDAVVEGNPYILHLWEKQIFDWSQ